MNEIIKTNARTLELNGQLFPEHFEFTLIHKRVVSIVDERLQVLKSSLSVYVIMSRGFIFNFDLYEYLVAEYNITGKNKAIYMSYHPN